MTLNKINIIDYTTIVLLISTSGFLVFTNNNIFTILTFVLLGFIFFYKNLKFTKEFYFINILLLTIYLIHALKFEFIPYNTIIGVYLRILIAYFAIQILSEKFSKIYVDVIIKIFLVSLLFYIPLNIIPGLDDMLKTFSLGEFENGYQRYKHTIGVYTIPSSDSLYRNSGPFWEPGAFAGYIIIAIVLRLIQIQSLNDRKIKFLVFALLTTLSTTGFIAFGFMVLLHFIVNKNTNYFQKKLMFLLGFIVFIAIFFQTDVLYKKIQEQVKVAQSTELRFTNDTQRFLNVLRDIEDFKGHEFFGRGPHSDTRFSQYSVTVRTNGFTDLLVEYGLFFSIILYFLIYRSFNNNFYYYHGYYNKGYSAGLLFVVLILLQSEIYFDFPLIWTLIFLNFKRITYDKTQITTLV